MVNNGQELIDMIIKLHENSELQNQMVKNAIAILENNKGALVKHLEKIEGVFA